MNPYYLGLILSCLVLFAGVVTKVAVLNRESKIHSRVLFSPNGQLNLVTREECDGKQVSCRVQNDKDKNAITQSINELKTMVVAADLKRESAREEQLLHQQKVEIYMANVSKLLETPLGGINGTRSTD